MPDGTCVDCENPRWVREWCQRHYYRARRAGRIAPLVRPTRLSDVDLESGTATCSVCTAVVEIYVRPGGRVECQGCKRRSRSATRRRASIGGRRAEMIRYRYGIAYEEYLVMLEAQDNRCLICGAQPPEGKVLVIDHDHATGAVRGLLCQRCNQGLGFFGDDQARLARALRYLKRSA